MDGRKLIRQCIATGQPTRCIKQGRRHRNTSHILRSFYTQICSCNQQLPRRKARPVPWPDSHCVAADGITFPRNSSSRFAPLFLSPDDGLSSAAQQVPSRCAVHHSPNGQSYKWPMQTSTNLRHTFPGPGVSWFCGTNRGREAGASNGPTRRNRMCMAWRGEARRAEFRVRRLLNLFILSSNGRQGFTVCALWRRHRGFCGGAKTAH